MPALRPSATSATVSLVAAVSTSLLPQFPAQSFDLGTPTRNPDNTLTLPFTAEPGHYYVLWRFDQPSSPPKPHTPHPGATPVRILVPDPADPDYPNLSVTDPNPNLTSAFYRLSASPLYLPGDADRDGIDDLHEIADPENLDPFNPTDATTDPDNNGSTLLDDYYSQLVTSPVFTKPPSGTSPQPPPTTPDPTTPELNLAELLGVDVVNDAASDYTPTPDAGGNISFIGSSRETPAGFQYPGTYYWALGNEGRVTRGNFPLNAQYECWAGNMSVVDANYERELFYTYNLFFTIDSEGLPLFSTELDRNAPGVYEAKWKDIFPNLESPCETFGPVYVDENGNPAITANIIEYDPFWGLDGAEARVTRVPGYSTTPFKLVGATFLHTELVLGSDPPRTELLYRHTRRVQNEGYSTLGIGFFSDTMQLQEPWGLDKYAEGYSFHGYWDDWDHPDNFPTFTGSPDDAKRVYVATFRESTTASAVVQFPLLESAPSFTLAPDDPTAPSTAHIRTSTADPHRSIRTGSSPNSLTEVQKTQLRSAPDLDTALASLNLLPLQDLDPAHTNDFGQLTVPTEGVKLIDSSLLSDSLTTGDATLVGLPDKGAQIGTFKTSATNVRQIGAQSATSAWIRSSPNPDDPPANHPTGIFSDGEIDTYSAVLSAHSVELNSKSDVCLYDCHLTSTATPSHDPITGLTQTTDPRNLPLGYVNLICPGGWIFAEDCTIDAASNVAVHSPYIEIWGSTFTAQTGSVHFAGADVVLRSTGPLSAASELAFTGTDHGSNLSVSASGSATLTAGDRISIDHFDRINLNNLSITTNSLRLRALGLPAPGVSSQLRNTTVEARSSLIVTNHELRIAGTTTIQNGQLATPTLRVDDGATLTLTGPDAALYTNTHHYGKPGYGTLTINGTEIIPPPDAPPTFHLRPHFDAQ